MSSGKEVKRERETSSGESTPPWSSQSGSGSSEFHSRSPSQTAGSTTAPGLINRAVSLTVNAALAGQKIPIPRGNTKLPEYHHRNRATRACDPCRLHKVKCEGEHPPCKRCLGLGLLCVYADVKRVRQMKQIEYLEHKVERYEKLLQEIIPLVDERTSQLIQRALEVEPNPPFPDSFFPSPFLAVYFDPELAGDTSTNLLS